MEEITIIGTGYVGLVTGVCLSAKGNKVTCYDIDAGKIRTLKKGKVPFYEPDVVDLLRREQNKGRLQFIHSLERALVGARFVFICVGTPPQKNGGADMRAYWAVVKELGGWMKKTGESPIVINKSTVPIGTAREAAGRLRETIGKEVGVVSNPEFLREGQAVKDFMKPDRIICGFPATAGRPSGDHPKGGRQRKLFHDLKELFRPFRAPKLFTSWETAETVKYAANAFLATKISFINEIAQIAEKVGANVQDIAKGMGYDPRIGSQFLRAGVGYGGSCFPKDVKALHHLALHKAYSFKLLKSVIEVNNQQRMHALQKIFTSLGKSPRGKTVAVLGLSFKPETDDTRESASIFVIRELVKKGVRVRAYDPVAMENALKNLKGRKGVVIVHKLYEVFKNADCVFLATEWKEFLSLNWKRVKKEIRGTVVVDGRNVLDQKKIEAIGLQYIGFGV